LFGADEILGLPAQVRKFISSIFTVALKLTPL
jgi:hypothetical protein